MRQLQKIHFSVGGKNYKLSADDDVGPETTLNTYLRKKAHLTGTKRMCLEGGCGACIVAVEETVAGKTSISAVNSCLVSVLSCHGWKIHTIEGIGDPSIGLHPVQKLLADNNGTQCGFCSPGMVMNMFALRETGRQTKEQIENSFAGNICRCTGYRPILSAFKKLASDADELIDIEELKLCRYKERRQKTERLEKIENSENYFLEFGSSKWMKVHTLKDLIEILRITPTYNYMLVGGNTGRGVYRQKILPDVYIDVSSVKELINYSMNGRTLVLGSNLTLTKTMDICQQFSNKDSFHYLTVIRDHLDLVATIPVRNIGTLAGNLMLKHQYNEFASDIFLLLETFHATIFIVDVDDNEILCTPKDFLKVDMRKKIIKNIMLNALDDNICKYSSYKIMPRAQNAHAMVNAGFLIMFENDVVRLARIVFGGINPQFVHATNTENALKGQKLFDNNVLQRAFKLLNQEIQPDYVLPDPTPQYRRQLAISLFYKFILSITPEELISSRNKSGGTLLRRPVSNGIQEYGTNKDKWPLTEPMHKLEGYAQTSGQAKYVDDIPDLPNQLHAAFVTAKATPNSIIVSVDASPALRKKGVVRYLDKKDIPGLNTFTPKISGNTIEEELFCSGRVQYYDQPIGIIVANDQELAWNAAELVVVEYTAPKTKPYLDMRDVVKANVQDRIKHQTTVVPRGKGTDVKHIIRGDFYIGHQYHYHMEVQCCQVIPTDDDGLEIYPSTQSMDAVQMAVAAILKIPTNKISIFVRRVGGAFGAKLTRNALVTSASALAAHTLRAPVRMSLSLEKNMDVIGMRFPFYVEYEVGVDDEGVVQYLDGSYYSDTGVGGNEPIDSLLIEMIPNCYDSKYWSYSSYTVTTDTPANCYTRGPGTAEALASTENIMEHIAYTLGLDPSDVKLANMNKTNFPKVLNYWKEMLSWGDVSTRKNAINDFNEANRWKKKGFSLVPMAWTLEVAASYTVLVSIFHGDGGVVITHGGIEIGQGINTKVAQMCAYKFEINMDLVSIKPNYNCITPNASSTGGSLTTEAVCYTVVKACDTLIERMKPIKVKMKNPTWAQLVNQCFNENIQLAATGFFASNSPGVEEYKIIGVCATEVELDILTGQRQILRVDIIEDLGESMNPYIDIGQVEGAFIMGLGYHTLERIIHDENGKNLTDRTWTYKPPGAKDIPLDFRIKFPNGNHETTLGVLKSKAAAEPPLCLSVSVPLGIRNALASARREADSTQAAWVPFVSANDDIGPETTLNTYLRKKAHLTGTKRMCLEGGCGTCIVAVEEIINGKRKVFAVNSCLVSILSCHGWKIHTIDGIGNSLIGLHPIQKLLADNNGTQCGFCSPGMVMNMFALHESGKQTRQQIENSFGGNICRCTSYRPIMSAFKKLASDADDLIDIEDLELCQYDECKQRIEVLDDEEKTKNVSLDLGVSKWMKVHTLNDLMEVLEITKTNNYMLVGGNTGRGVYRQTWQTVLPEVYIDVTSVKELTSYSVNGNSLLLGGNLSLTKLMDIFQEVSKLSNFQYLTVLRDHVDVIATVPIRNIGTIAGNLMLKYQHNEFQSDIFLLLETFNATLVIAGIGDKDVLCSPKDFLNVDMRKKVIKNILLPGVDERSFKYGSYKIMPISQNAHAMVNAGFLVKHKNNIVESARIVYGGINPQFIHATKTEDFLKGKNLFDNNTLQAAFKSLDQEIKPDYVLPDPTPEYRKKLAISLFYKFILKVCPDNLVSSRNKSGGTMPQRPVSEGIQEYGTNRDKWPLTEPLLKLEAYAQTSGQAKYVDDMVDLPNQLHAAFVTASAIANSQIVSVDASPALKMKGVVRFFDKNDIPGVNTFMPKVAGLAVQEELFCSGRVQYYHQPIGIIVATDQELAWNAAERVKVTYKPPAMKPYLNVRDVVKANAKDKIKHQTTVVPSGKGKDIKHVIKGEFYIGQQYHYHMEVQCCNVVPTDDDGLDIYPVTQWMDVCQMAAAAVLNIPTHKINVDVRRVGGSFGGKITRNNFLSTASALAAHKLKVPVRMTLPLEKNMDIIGKRYPLYMEYDVGFDDKGVIQYLEASFYSDHGVGGNEVMDFLLLDLIPNCYESKYWSYSTYAVQTDTSANCSARAPGSTEGLAATENIMEHIASVLGLDPMDVKRANMNTGKNPKALKYWKEIQTWGDLVARKKAVNEYNQANRWTKRGLSLVPMVWTLPVVFSYSVFVSIFHGDGGVAVAHGGIEIGQGINTKVAQMCAFKFGITMDMVSIKKSNNFITPNSHTTGGSFTTEAVCYAVVRACETLIERMKPVKAKMKNPSWAELVNACYRENILLCSTGNCAPNLPGVEEYKIVGVGATEVEVDILTGLRQVLRVDIIEDVGESMNPYVDIGQIEGAFVMGLGYFTTEEIINDADGKLMTNRTWTYKPPGAKDIPINFRIKFANENHEVTMGVLKSKAAAEPPLCLSVSVPLAIRQALDSARKEADASRATWIPFNGPTTVEFAYLNSLNDYKQYTL